MAPWEACGPCFGWCWSSGSPGAGRWSSGSTIARLQRRPHRRRRRPVSCCRCRNVRGGERGGQTERVGTIYNYVAGDVRAAPIRRARRSTPPPRDAVADTVRRGHRRCADATLACRSEPAARRWSRRSGNTGWTARRSTRASVVVAYDLVDRDGRIRWHADARGDSSVMVLIFGNGLVKNFRVGPVAGARSRPGDAFRSPTFWAALRGPPTRGTSSRRWRGRSAPRIHPGGRRRSGSRK